MAIAREDIKRISGEYIEAVISNVCLGMTESELRTNSSELSKSIKLKIEEALNPIGMITNQFLIEIK